MAVGKRKAAASIMVGSGSIKPLWIFHPKGKSRIVEAVDIFVHQHPEQGRTRIANIGEFAVGGPR